MLRSKASPRLQGHPSLPTTIPPSSTGTAPTATALPPLSPFHARESVAMLAARRLSEAVAKAEAAKPVWPKRVTMPVMGLTLLATLTLLVIFSVGAAHCTTEKQILDLQSNDATTTMREITSAICAIWIDIRYWLIAMLSVNTITLIILLGCLAHECCQLNVTVTKCSGSLMFTYMLGHGISSCMLVGWMYVHEDMTAVQLRVIHTATVTLLVATLITTTAIATTLLVDLEVLTKSSSAHALTPKVARSQRQSMDLEAARAAIAATTQQHSRLGGNDVEKRSGLHSPESSLNHKQQHSRSTSQLRGRFGSSSPPVLHATALPNSHHAHGMSLTEIKQIATQIIPCCTPTICVDPITGEKIPLPCCERAPVLPTSILPVGFTSPREKDHGPVADLTDAITVAPAAIPPLTSPPPQSQFIIPKHLHLNTTSPMNAGTGPNSLVDIHPANTPLGLHAPIGSALHAVLCHGPLADDAGCELCRDLFTAHQLVKILPHCSHAFHSSCLVPYLKHRRDCPRCHVEVMLPSENHHADLSNLQMNTPASTTDQSSKNLTSSQKNIGSNNLHPGTPPSMRAAMRAAASPLSGDLPHQAHSRSERSPESSTSNSTSTSAFHLNVNVLTSPPQISQHGQPPSACDSLSSLGEQPTSAVDVYGLDSVKLTPPFQRGLHSDGAPLSTRPHPSPTKDTCGVSIAMIRSSVLSPTSHSHMESLSTFSTSQPHPIQSNLSPIFMPNSKKQ